MMASASPTGICHRVVGFTYLKKSLSLCMARREFTMSEKIFLLFVLVVSTIAMVIGLDDLVYHAPMYTIVLTLIAEACFIFAVVYILRNSR